MSAFLQDFENQKKYFDIFANEIIEIKENQKRNIGVYFLYEGERVIYIGKSVNYLIRPFEHKREFKFDKVFVFPVPIEFLDFVESAFVGLFRPIKNGYKNKFGQSNGNYCVKDKIAFDFCEEALGLFLKFKNQNFTNLLGEKITPWHAHNFLRQLAPKQYLKKIGVSVAQTKRWELFRQRKALEATCP